MSEHTHLLVFGNGYWGVGTTFAEALKNAKWLRKGDAVVTATCPPGTRVDEIGTIYTPAGTTLGEFVHGTIAGSRNAPTFKQ